MPELNIYGPHKIISEHYLKKVLKASLSSIYASENGYIDLIFASEGKIKELNDRFRDINKPTDVLSFGYENEDCRGEIVICQKMVQKFAKEEDKNFKEELLKTFIHGVLHLYGYDHIRLKDKKKMEEKEWQIFQKIK